MFLNRNRGNNSKEEYRGTTGTKRNRNNSKEEYRDSTGQHLESDEASNGRSVLHSIELLTKGVTWKSPNNKTVL